MARSRPPISAAEEEPANRSKRRRVALGGDSLEGGASGPNDGKKALYHCNYCNKGISGTIRIKCTKCPNFDLCVECFSVGAEVTPHKCNHPYRVIDNLSFPLIHPDWNADEEILLLEGVEMYGIGNWTEVAENVSTKTKTQCFEHYMATYMNSSCSPLPDMSHAHGKSKSDLLAVTKTQTEDKKCIGLQGEDDEKLLGDKAITASNASADGGQGNRSVGVQKPKPLVEDSKAGSIVYDQSGYNPKREEFEPEYDNEAERPLAEMEFKDNDTETDHGLKIRMLHIYLSRLDERKRRREFVLQKGLLDFRKQQAPEKKRSKEERELHQRARVFLRYHSSDDHEALLAGLFAERKIRQCIVELQECRAAGCRTLAEAEQYKMEKLKQEESTLQRNKEGAGNFIAGKLTNHLNKPASQEKADGEVDTLGNLTESQSTGMFSAATPTTTSKGMEKPISWELTGLPGTDLLTSTEINLCTQVRLLPANYLKIKEVLMLESLKNGRVKRVDAHRLIKADVNKVDKVYDLLSQFGSIQGDVNSTPSA